VKSILEKSVNKQTGEVNKPGTTEKVAFTELCVSGGTISAPNAVELAEKTKAAKASSKAIWREAGAGKIKTNLARQPRA
jgi:hypothetical protein